MQIDLTIRKETDPNFYTITCDVDDRVVFGRNIGSPVNLDGSGISREHFVLLSRNGEICVQDLSSNGTVVNGKRVAQNKPQKLSRGDIIYVPGYEIELGKRLATPLATGPERIVVSPQREETLSRWLESFTVWEIIVTVAAIASFFLVVYYIAR